MFIRSLLLLLAAGWLVLAPGSSAKLSGAGAAPTSIVSIVSNPTSGTLTAIGTAVTFTVCYGGNVTIAGGTPTLPIATSTVSTSATYTSGSGTGCHVYDYTLTANAAANPVATTSAGISPNGATFTDANGFSAINTASVDDTFSSLVFSPGGPAASVTGCSSSPSSGNITSGGTITFTCDFSASVTVSGVPKLGLNTSPSTTTASYSGGSPGTAILFAYTAGSNTESPVTTLASGAISVGTGIGTINTTSGGAPAILTGANGETFTGLNLVGGGGECVGGTTTKTDANGDTGNDFVFFFGTTPGSYGIFLGPWNMGSGNTWNQSIEFCTATVIPATITWAVNGACLYNTCGYNALVYGVYNQTTEPPVPITPAQINSIASLTFTWGVTLGADGGVNNDVIFDTFTTNSSGWTGGNEVHELVLYAHPPSYSQDQINSIRAGSGGTSCGDFTVSGVALICANGGGTIFVMQADGDDILNATNFNYLEYMQDLVANGAISGSEWFNGASFGAETNESTSSLVISTFSAAYSP